TDTFELIPPKLGHVDQRMLAIGRLIRKEILRSDITNEDCLDSLITEFGIYLLRNYSSTKDNVSSVFKGGLAPRAWKKVNDYIHAHLSEKISLSEMAQIAQLS